MVLLSCFTFRLTSKIAANQIVHTVTKLNNYNRYWIRKITISQIFYPYSHTLTQHTTSITNTTSCKKATPIACKLIFLIGNYRMPQNVCFPCHVWWPSYENSIVRCQMEMSVQLKSTIDNSRSFVIRLARTHKISMLYTLVIRPIPVDVTYKFAYEANHVGNRIMNKT